MLPELVRGRADRAARARLRPVLGIGPWCWPTDAASPAAALARDITGLPSPPAAAIGTIAGLSVERTCGFAWILHTGAALRRGPEVGTTTRQSWDAASLALPRSVPLLWQSVNAAHAGALHLLPVGAHLTEPGQAPPCDVVSGPSFGLALFLLQASLVFRVSLPGDLVASAAVAADGRVEEVDGLDVKLATIRALLPSVTRVLVAASQVSDAERHAGPLEVIGVHGTSQALEHVFGDRLAGLLLQEGLDGERRRSLCEWFFRFALEGRGELVDWSPIAAAASRALAQWPDLTADQRFQLAFALGIAERHEFNAGSLPVPSPAQLAARPAHLRLHLLAHLVQQSADSGTPAPDTLVPLLDRFAQPDLHEGHPMAWRVEGARARLLAVTGRPIEALRRQEALARTYYEALLYRDISFPLAEWFRLAGATGDHDAFARADAMLASILPLGPFGFQGQAYIDLARSRAALALGVPDREPARAVLAGLAGDAAGPQHVRWAAARAWLRATDPAAPAAAALRGMLAREAAVAQDRRSTHPHASQVAHALVRMDDALAAADDAAAQLALDDLGRLQPGIVDHLMRAAGGLTPATYVARYFPY
ncbi:hypothetical protein TBR22_A46740 [Luteitalea sp. TBR-22]|uniref:hypothetical protein n=1 Tax=Luteitalea sp. TBR-22 TaxID=2802971 RepID=UPI001AF8AA20|nr:hypothetical protein [Luteitalea sp. TBR-22]BCS35447.1 hypothetical protein TBR22_A46740 [Luteitalea sp. TBR-22]